ncbi:MAG: DMT family transporter [Eubacteriales bacterium]|nr:DMT family transporter [Eubacteriales bacterium]
MQEQKKTTGLGIFFLLLTAVVWGFAFVAQTVGSDHVGAFLFNGIRFALGGISLLPVIALFEKKNPDPASHKQLMRTTVTAGIVCGILLCSASTLQQYGIELFQRAGFPDSSGRAGFLTALYMVLVPLFNLFTGKKAGLFTWIGVGFAAIGLFLVSVSSAFTISPEDLVVLGCAVLFAAHILVIDRFGDGLYSLRFSMIQFFVCAVVSFIAWGISIVTGLHTAESFSDLKAALVPILYGGFMSVGVAYTCQVLGQKRADPAVASVLLSMESMFSVIGGALILHERMTARGYIGCVLIFLGVLCTQVKFRHKPAPAHSTK